MRRRWTTLPSDEQVWAGWLIAVLCSFGALEATLQTALCHALRRWLRIHPQRPGHRVSGAILLGALAWFGAHVLDKRQARP